MSDLTAKNLNNLKSSVEAQVSDVTNSYVSDSNNNDYSEYSVIFEEDFHESDSDGESDNDDSILDLNLDHTIISDTIQNVLVNLDPAVTKDVWQFIQNWAVEFSIQRTAVTALLHYLNKYFPDLPLDSRTVLKTPREIVTTEVPPGRYYHIGLESNLLKILELEKSTAQIAIIDINIDGLPVFKDGRENSFWLILGRFFNISSKVFVIGVYQGVKKPDDFNTSNSTHGMVLKLN
jgi:hypothetical protein